ncbi:hypothetical protein F3Y22_tig00001478pilonHSYRG00412 [Hibiscus syriacus]|uniref:Protein kinase domain-containing protein n=1 Tax=Hibiscus syriacus TaxID=106335 RepID=A0A6A3CVR4_HIBSY|nr:hypothetical protein F3Y22_tig00001478pilonHSYRG00412 [Hibiscus syriacus]
MRIFRFGLVLGIIIGVGIGFVSAMAVMWFIRYRRKRLDRSINKGKVLPTTEKLPICVSGSQLSAVFGFERRQPQKATSNFTTTIGEGAFGPISKARMETDVSVKVLANDSNKQGQWSSLQRNLVNLMGYSAERGRHMLVYAYISNGSLASHLYSENHQTLSRNLRVQIALDVARGLEYLHYGVADFGISRQENSDLHSSDVKRTFGYIDPEYISTLAFTRKSNVAIGAGDHEGREQIADPRLEVKFDVQQLNHMAGLAYTCVNPVSRKRPTTREIVLALSEIHKPMKSETYCAVAADTTFELDLKGTAGYSLTER